MQKFNTAASEANTPANLTAYFRANGDHEIADNLLIQSGPLELCSDQSYQHSDERPSVSEMEKELAFIRQHMIALKTHPETVTPEPSDAVIRALYSLAYDALEQLADR
ncbi:hypothetical protein L9Z73_01460 [Pseudomonas sp. TNT11]|uniref:DUF3077 domain-containing protein n=1 Tax=Pseudomonas emilianonis TaxID=2915812 RepID=A0ABT0EBI4_9PSED|nr:hypothetical protein [Pseudomonas emilianonis]MCK1783077.1 hypothetical protein [Pseudomonas emilianonis]